MTATPKTTSTANLVAHVPGMLGFHPGDSIVLTGLTEQGRHAMSARFDHDTLVPLTSDALGTSLERMRERDARFVLVVTYHRQDTRESLTPLTDALEAAGMLVHDVGAVEGGQWVSLVTGERAPLPATDAATSGPEYSREVLVASLTPTGGPALEAALDEAETPTGAGILAAIEAWAGLLSGRIEPTDRAMVAAVPLLRAINYRDMLMVTCMGSTGSAVPGMVPVEHAERITEALPNEPTDTAREALVGMCRAVPAKHAPDLLAFAAMVHLTGGYGAHGTMLAEQALAIQADHRLSVMVHRMAELGMDPSDA